VGEFLLGTKICIERKEEVGNSDKTCLPNMGSDTHGDILRLQNAKQDLYTCKLYESSIILKTFLYDTEATSCPQFQGVMRYACKVIIALGS